ncbi:amidase family protein [Nocardioides solisilvae]|uniref:amidase family protein n=1 Tax=Nocardioides solisilvae TaxID=1542435 RepID=UPI000D7429FA|nr:amidase family protein [Nocardioides solisilvae]
MTRPRPLIASLCALALGASLVPGAAWALTPVTTDDGATWNVNDARRPGLDTGSIRNVSNSRLEAFGSLFLRVEGGSHRMNGEMLRGFGITEVSAGSGSYVSTASVLMDGVSVARQLDVAKDTGTGTFLDTFTNTTTKPVTLRASFGGSLGYGVPTASTAGRVTATSDGDGQLDGDDTWLVATTAGNFRPTGVVVGSVPPARLGDQQNAPFTDDYSPTGSAQNDPGFVHELTIAPGATASLLHYVHVGARGDSSAVVGTTQALAATPDTSALTLDQLCTVANWEPGSLPGIDPATCVGADPLQLPPAVADPTVRTTVEYDVTGKTAADLRRDMRAGVVTSVEITQAYLDRIAAYDQGPLGFKSFIHVADDALEQAAAADAARAAGDDRPMLGIPIAIKDLFDVEGQPNTGGIKSLATWEPESDAWQIAAMRRAGAVFLGKTNLSEFANSGSFSESGFMQSWNGLHPSKTSFGSSGGSAAAVAADLAPISMGTQTGVSLYAPATGASLSTFRGTDGLTSAEGVMPLTWAQDYAGPIGQTVTDLAIVLDATATRTTGNNPADVLTNRVEESLRPESFSAGLDAGALRGRKVGYLPGSFASAQVSDDPAGADTLADVRAAVEAAGGELVEITTPAPGNPAAPGPISGNSGAHGWVDYITSEQTFPYRTPGEVWKNLANLPYNVSGTSVDSRTPYDETSVANLLARRDAYKAAVATWMDDAGVDVVAYPGFLTQPGNNDASSAALSSDRASGVLTSNVGLPTVVIPVGTTSEGYSNSLQLVGRAWSDAEVLAMGYAVEQVADARVRGTHAPALEYAGPADSVVGLRLDASAVERGTAARATVSVISARQATGPVTVTVDGRTVTGTLAGGTATVALPADLPAGRHLVVARFGGTGKVAAGEAAAELKVTAGRTQVALAAAADTVTVGSDAVVTVTATGASGPAANGTVLVKRGEEVLRSATLGADGTASFTLAGLAVGRHELTATVTSSADQASGTSAPVTVTVVRARPAATAKLKGKKVRVALQAPTPVEGTVRFAARGKVFAKVRVADGKAVVPLRKVPGRAGKSVKVKVTYLGSESLLRAKATVKVKKRR